MPISNDLNTATQFSTPFSPSPPFSRQTGRNSPQTSRRQANLSFGYHPSYDPSTPADPAHGNSTIHPNHPISAAPANRRRAANRPLHSHKSRHPKRNEARIANEIHSQGPPSSLCPLSQRLPYPEHLSSHRPPCPYPCQRTPGTKTSKPRISNRQWLPRAGGLPGVTLPSTRQCRRQRPQRAKPGALQQPHASKSSRQNFSAIHLAPQTPPQRRHAAKERARKKFPAPCPIPPQLFGVPVQIRGRPRRQRVGQNQRDLHSSQRRSR